MLGLPPQLTWHPFPLTAQHTTVKAQRKLLTLYHINQKLHQWHPRIFEIWIGRKWSTRWKPSKNIPRCNLRPQTVPLFFRPKKSWRDCDCGDIRSTGLTLPLVPWVDAAFFEKMCMMYYIEVSKYVKLNLEDMINVVDANALNTLPRSRMDSLTLCSFG